MVQWIQTVAPFAAQASACQFGKDWSKTWMFVANRAEIFAVAKSCPHGFGVHQQITGVRMADGTFFSRLTSEYPQELADALATVIAPFVSHSGLKMEGVCRARRYTCHARHLTLQLAYDPDGSNGSVIPNSA